MVMTKAEQFEAMARRRTVATWIESMSGVPVPTSSDYSFRSSLRDGILLCRIINTIKPLTISKVIDMTNEEMSESDQIFENIENFIKGCQDLGMDENDIFSVEDLMEGTWEDRPKVVECLYELQKVAEKTLGDKIKKGNRFFNCSNNPSPLDSVSSQDQHNEMKNMCIEGIDPLDPDLPSELINAPLTEPEDINSLMLKCTNIMKDRVSSRASLDVQPSYSTLPLKDNGMKSLESMLKKVLAGITYAQEQRGKQDLEAMQKHIKMLEEEIDVMKQMPHVVLQEDTGLTNDEMASLKNTATELSTKMEVYQREKENLVNVLEKEKLEKEVLAQTVDQMKSKVESFDGIQTKYKEIKKENNKLYNMVQDLKGNIRVFVRVRPLGLTGDEGERCIETTNENELIVTSSNTSSNASEKVYKFDRVFAENSTQELVYSETQPLIRSVLDGYNVCIFAYGQTGSGKTHTMSGTNVEEYSGRGINYRSLDDLFDIKQNRSDEVDYTINVQMLEIYNESLRDLLKDPAQENNIKLEIKSTKGSGSNVPDAVQVPVNCTGDVLRVMDLGQSNRAVGCTSMNARSSRSHSVLTIIVDGYSHVTKERTHGCLHLVDLAGSERVGRSEASGDRLKEAQYINKSLSALGDVMSALASKTSHIPYRNSKLTHLLQDSLAGSAKSMMFIHVSPEISSKNETLSTVMFGNRVSQITLGAASKNTEHVNVIAAREAISKLKEVSHKKDSKITELQRVIESERIACKEALSEKEQLKYQLKKLQRELELSHRSTRTVSKSTRHHRRTKTALDDSDSSISVKENNDQTGSSSSQQNILSSSNSRNLNSSISSSASSEVTTVESLSKKELSNNSVPLIKSSRKSIKASMTSLFKSSMSSNGETIRNKSSTESNATSTKGAKSFLKSFTGKKKLENKSASSSSKSLRPKSSIREQFIPSGESPKLNRNSLSLSAREIEKKYGKKASNPRRMVLSKSSRHNHSNSVNGNSSEFGNQTKWR